MATTMAKFMGGSRDFNAVMVSQLLPREGGRFIRMRPGTTGLNLKLPNALNLPLGGPYYFITQQGTVTFDINNDSDTLLITVAVNAPLLVISLRDNTTTDGVWSIEDGVIPPPFAGPFYYADSTDPAESASETDIYASNDGPLP